MFVPSQISKTGTPIPYKYCVILALLNESLLHMMPVSPFQDSQQNLLHWMDFQNHK